MKEIKFNSNKLSIGDEVKVSIGNRNYKATLVGINWNKRKATITLENHIGSELKEVSFNDIKK